MKSNTIPQPLFYKGWVIQPHPYGYHVYSIVDSSKPCMVCFACLYEAYEYIDDEITIICI